MPTRDTAPLGAPCWIDLMSSDVAGARAFYGELFGWTSEDTGPDYGGYVTFAKDGVTVAGAMARTPEMGPVPDVWSVYLASDDAERTVASAVSHGGTVVVPAMPVMELGSMAVVADTGGAAIGIWQPGLHRGFGVLAEPGAPSWFELHTRDYDAAVAFYRDVFGWDTHVMSDSAELRYTTLGGGDEQAAGIMDASAHLPDGVPAHWAVYLGTADTDASVARAVELGGSVQMPAEDTPYGRIAMLADPTGAVFRVVG